MKQLLVSLLLVQLAACEAERAPEAERMAGQRLLARVDDGANLLSSELEQQISDRLAALERRTSDQVAVKTVQNLGGKTIEEYSLATARQAGLGQKGKDNGLLLLVAPNERQVRIETGRGIAGVITDAEAGEIVRAMLEQFRAGRAQQAVADAVQSIERELEADPTRPQLLRRDEPWPA